MGYTGGDTVNPTYNTVCSGDGHTEALKVEFDPDQLSYEDVLSAVFSRGGFRSKPQYQTAVWPQNEEQASVAAKMVEETGVKVPVLPAKTFYDAEDYHQKYYERRRR